MLRSQTAFSISQYTHTPETSTVSIRLRINTKNFIKITQFSTGVWLSETGTSGCDFTCYSKYLQNMASPT